MLLKSHFYMGQLIHCLIAKQKSNSSRHQNRWHQHTHTHLIHLDVPTWQITTIDKTNQNRQHSSQETETTDINKDSWTLFGGSPSSHNNLFDTVSQKLMLLGNAQLCISRYSTPSLMCNLFLQVEIWRWKILIDRLKQNTKGRSTTQTKSKCETKGIRSYGRP